MVQTDSTYWYGVTAAVYIATCWIFSVVFVSTEAAYLDSHLKLEQVVERCNFSRRYVSKVFTERFGGFSDYVNGLRLNYFERYKLQHPSSTDESAAEASGFTSYKAYLKAKERLPQK